MKGFIVYPTYSIQDNKAYVHLFGRLENGESFQTINHFRPYFFMRTKEKEKLKDIENAAKYELKDTDKKNFYEEPVTRVTLDIPRDVPGLRDAMHKADIPTYEADIRFVYRYMIDKGIKGSLDIQGDFEKGELVDRIYTEPTIGPADHIPELKILSLDIETSMDMKSLYSIALSGKGLKEVLLVHKMEVDNARTFSDEKGLLLQFAKIIKEYDPDIITGWNLIDFDFNIIKKKFDAYNIPFVLGRNGWEASLRIQSSFIRDSTADIPGRMVLDGMHLLRINNVSLSDYKLQTAAEEILGETKLELFEDLDKGAEIERFYKEEPERLAEYNLKDTELVPQILHKKNILDVTIQRSLLTGMQLDRVKASIASLDNLYLRETQEKGYVAPTMYFKPKERPLTGGYVHDSIPGIYDNILVLDFKSLYPSIMRTFNIDPLSFIPKELHDKYDDYIEAPNGARFKREWGIMPMLLHTLWQQRDKAKKKNNQEASYAIKITMNSFFGVLGNPRCRFFNLDMANAITYFGRFIVKKTIEMVEEKGYKVIYGDTDSIFVHTQTEDTQKAKEIGREVQDIVNAYWDNKIQEDYRLDSFLQMEFEKTYVRFIMPKIRGTDKGAKKRYAGLIVKDGKEKIDFTGLEFVRRDWTDLSKKFQLELLGKVFHKEEVSAYIKTFVDDLKEGKYDDLLTYRKALRKDISEYTKTTPQHVKAAKKLDRITSNIIAYVITVDGPEPMQNIQHTLDYDHYIEKQVKPIANQVLRFYDLKFDEVLKDTKQTSLFGFS